MLYPAPNETEAKRIAKHLTLWALETTGYPRTYFYWRLAEDLFLVSHETPELELRGFFVAERDRNGLNYSGADRIYFRGNVDVEANHQEIENLHSGSKPFLSSFRRGIMRLLSQIMVD